MKITVTLGEIYCHYYYSIGPITSHTCYFVYWISISQIKLQSYTTDKIKIKFNTLAKHACRCYTHINGQEH